MKYSHHQKQQHVTCWQQSGLTQRVYCQQHGISLSRFKNWPARYTAQSYTCLPITITPTAEEKKIILYHLTGVRVALPADQLPTVLQALLSC